MKFKTKDKTIIFLTDNETVIKDKFMKTMSSRIVKEGGEIFVRPFNNAFIEHFKKNYKLVDVIIFDLKNNFEILRKLKKITNNFASIVLVRDDYIEALSIELYGKFDAHITIATIGCWAENECPFSEKRVMQKIESALKIHQLKHDSTISIIQKFIKLIEIKENHTLLDIIDSTGKVIAIDKNVREVFGDIENTYVQKLEHKYDGVLAPMDRGELKILNEGDKIEIKDINGNFVETRLVTQWIFENGTTYYVQVWELTEDIIRFNDCIKALEKVKKDIKTIRIQEKIDGK